MLYTTIIALALAASTTAQSTLITLGYTTHHLLHPNSSWYEAAVTSGTHFPLFKTLNPHINLHQPIRHASNVTVGHGKIQLSAKASGVNKNVAAPWVVTKGGKKKRDDTWVASTTQCGYDWEDANNNCYGDCSNDLWGCPDPAMSCFANTVGCVDGAGTQDGSCGNGSIGTGVCNDGSCCSQWGYCGTTQEFCSTNGNDNTSPDSGNPPELGQPAPAPAQQSLQAQQVQPDAAPQQQAVPDQQAQPDAAPQQQADPAQQSQPNAAPQQQAAPAQQAAPQQQQSQQQAPSTPAAAADPNTLAGQPSAASAVNQQNYDRATVGLGGLSWDSGLENYALAWSQNLANQGCALIHGGGGFNGQNLAMWAGTNMPNFNYVDAMGLWWAEGPPCAGCEINHYWIMSGPYTKIGCAAAWGYGNGYPYCEIIHVIGLIAIMIQQAGVYDFTQLPQAANFISAYTVTQAFVFGFTFQIKSLINSSGGKEMPLVYRVHRTRIVSNYHEYDLKQYEETLSTNRIMFVVSTIAYFQLEFLSSFSLLVLGFLRMVSTATHPLFQIYIFGKPAVGELKRPWGPDEVFVSEEAEVVAPVEEGEKKEVGSEEKGEEKVEEVEKKVEGEKKSKK
ncbi:hypothetical protein HDU98_009020 [Podochytrium sp. JEL0797]|nr:hypothetical protein HDU98_009020 [Podochytrium sp. JEL0797]